MKDIATKVDLIDTLPANSFNSSNDELENVVVKSGQTLDATSETTPDPDPTQIARAITKGSQEAGHYTDSGAADVYVATASGSWQQPTAYTNGMRIYFTPANANTGASTINVAGLGVVDIKNVNATALNAGQLVTTKISAISFDSASGDFHLDDPTFGFTSGTGVQDTYIDNFGAEVGVEDWVKYKDAAQATPVDGTGGTANVTWTRTTTDPLQGLGSFLFTKDGVDRQGEGVSVDFKIGKGSRNLLQAITFQMLVDSGTYVSGDIAVYMYDVDTSTLITPNKVTLDDTTEVNYHQSTFTVPNTASDDYRFIVHVATVSSAAYTLKFDQFLINANAPELGATGSPKVYDESQVTVSGTGFTQTECSFGPYRDSVTNKWRKWFNISGTHAGITNLTLTVDGVIFQTGKNQAINVATNTAATGAEAYVTQAADTIEIIAANSATEIYLSGNVALDGEPTWSDFDGSLTTFNDSLAFANSKVRYYNTSGGAVTAGVTFPFDTEDTTTAKTIGVWANTAGEITVAESGTFDINLFMAVTALSSSRLLSLQVNRQGAGYNVERNFEFAEANALSISGIVKGILLVKGDLLKVTTTASVTVTAGTSSAYLEIGRNQDFSAGQGVGVGFAETDKYGLVKQPNGTVRLDTGNGHGSTNNKIRRYTNSSTVGDAFTYADTAADGASITVNVACVACVSLVDGHSAASSLGVSINSSQLTVSIAAITTADRLISFDNTSGLVNGDSVCFKFNIGDIIRPHDDGTPTNVTSRVSMVIQEMFRL